MILTGNFKMPGFIDGEWIYVHRSAKYPEAIQIPDHYFLRYVHPINYSPHTIKSLLTRYGFLTVYVDSEGNKGPGPKNIRVVAVKDNGEKLSSQTEKINYKCNQTVRI